MDPVTLQVVRAIGVRRLVKILAALVAAWLLVWVVVVPLVVGAVAGSVAGEDEQDTTVTATCGGTPGAGQVVPAGGGVQVPLSPMVGWDAEAVGNARVIAARGAAAGVGQRGVIVALAAAMQESSLRNLNHGHADSLGLFQQRPSSGWGTPEQIRAPAAAADAFYGVAAHTANPGLVDVPGWQSMTVAAAAQAVQRSAFPDAYARWEGEAGRLAAQVLDGVNVTTVACTGTAAMVSGRWAHPLAPAAYTPTSPFGMRRHPITGMWRLHAGTDLAAPTGTPIHSTCTGPVTQAGWTTGGGLTTTVDCGGGVEVFYMHQSVVGVRVGQQLTAGAVIGEVGNTGGSTGPHLHLGVRVAGAPTDPVPFFAAHGIRLR